MPPDQLTVLYDGDCPLCRREIAHVEGLAKRQSDSSLCFVDISGSADGAGGGAADGSAAFLADRAKLLARFHVQRADGSRLDGAEAFVAMWSRLPGWRWLARLASLPGMLLLLELAYRGFLLLRPSLQTLVRRLDAQKKEPQKSIDNVCQVASFEPTAGRLSPYLERELRSDHAGETGAVYIYRGIAAVAAWRDDAELQKFARQHGETELEHLRLIEDWLPSNRRSRLLGPWRLAGWLTGALPALAGRREVYATIAAVETFVDRHYQQQIDHLLCHGGPEGLLQLLQRCQEDERQHRDEAAALAGTSSSWMLRVWCALVDAGSAMAVVLARRV